METTMDIRQIDKKELKRKLMDKRVNLQVTKTKSQESIVAFTNLLNSFTEEELDSMESYGVYLRKLKSFDLINDLGNKEKNMEFKAAYEDILDRMYAKLAEASEVVS